MRTRREQKQPRCQTCGMTLKAGPVEFHPFTFCLLVQSKQDAWKSLRDLFEYFGLPGPDKPMTIHEVERAAKRNRDAT